MVGGELGQQGHCAGESLSNAVLRKTNAICPGLPCTRVLVSSSEKVSSREEEHFISLAKCVSQLKVPRWERCAELTVMSVRAGVGFRVFGEWD